MANDYVYELIDRLKTVSSSIQEYMDSQLYIQDIGEEVEYGGDAAIDVIFPILLHKTVLELKDLGILIDLDLQDLYSDSRALEALVSIRELMDKEHIKVTLKHCVYAREAIADVLMSNDTLDNEYLTHVLSILANTSTDVSDKIKSISEITDAHFVSTSMFEKHINAVLESIPPLSHVHDSSVSVYSTIAEALVLIKKDWEYLDQVFLKQRLITDLDADDQDRYYILHTSRMRDVAHASEYSWLLSLPLDVSKLLNQDAQDTLNNFNELALQNDRDSLGTLEYYRYRAWTTLTRADIISMIKVRLLSALAWTHESMSAYKWLYIRNIATPVTDMRAHLDPVKDYALSCNCDRELFMDLYTISIQLR